MDSRKLQKTGGTTYVLSLPKRWVEQQGLAKGSTLNVNERKGGVLEITPREFKKDPKEIDISAEDDLNRAIISRYLLGYDVLRIHSPKDKIDKKKNDIRKILQKLIGFEIMGETTNSITINNLLDPEEVSVLKTLRRMHTIVSVMHNDILLALKEKNKKLLKDVIQRDKEVNRLYFLVVRQIRTVIQNSYLQEKENISSVECVDYRIASNIIEQIGDTLVRIADLLLKENTPKNKTKIISDGEKVYLMHKRAAEALFKKDEKIAITVQKELASFKSTLPKPLTFPETELYMDLLRITDYVKDLADVVVDE